MDRLELIASKELGYNIDIDQHIISCRIALEIIELKDVCINENREENNKMRHEIGNLTSRLKIKEEELRQKDKEIEQYRQIIEECYNQMELLVPNKRQKSN